MFSQLCFVAYSVIGLEAMNYGSGVHQYNVMLSDFFVFLKVCRDVRLSDLVNRH
jgi:hypothetical protein